MGALWNSHADKVFFLIRKEVINDDDDHRDDDNDVDAGGGDNVQGGDGVGDDAQLRGERGSKKSRWNPGGSPRPSQSSD